MTTATRAASYCSVHENLDAALMTHGGGSVSDLDRTPRCAHIGPSVAHAALFAVGTLLLLILDISARRGQTRRAVGAQETCSADDPPKHADPSAREPRCEEVKEILNNLGTPVLMCWSRAAVAAA